MAEGLSNKPEFISKEKRAWRFDELEEQIAKLKRGTPEYQKLISEMAALADNLSKWRYIISVTEPGSDIFLMAQNKVKELKKSRVQTANDGKAANNFSGINEQRVARAKSKVKVVANDAALNQENTGGEVAEKNREYPESGKVIKLFGLISDKFGEFGVTAEDLLNSFSGYLRLNTTLGNFATVDELRSLEYRNLEEKNGELRFYVTVKSAQNRLWNRTIDLKLIDIKRQGKPAKGYHWMDFASKRK